MAKPSLQRELQKRRPFECPEQEAHLNILRTASLLMLGMERLFRDHGLSPAQYNILRILRGHGEEGLPCLEIGQQMVTRVPDMTRLIDRLERAGLVARQRCEEDRRVVRIMLTSQGRELLRGLDQPVLDAHKRNLGHLTAAELEQINQLMLKARHRTD